MRILTQDGMADLPYESIGICINYHTKEEIIAYPAGTYSPDDEYWTMARYSTESKAKKAMEMLHETYAGLPIIMQNVNVSEDVSELFDKWKKQVVCIKASADEPSKIEHINSGYFQFPADEDVED